jgi:hypothetical protein
VLISNKIHDKDRLKIEAAKYNTCLNNIFPVTGNNKEFCGNLSSFYPDKKAQEPKKTAEFMLCCGICNNKIGIQSIHNLSKNSIFIRLLSRSKGFSGIKKLPGRIRMGLVNDPAAGWNRLLISREEVEIATVLACGQSFRLVISNNMYLVKGYVIVIDA